VVAAWRTPAAFVWQNQFVFTAPDEGSIHCLSLQDGSLLWKAAQADDDAYVAGVLAGKVLIVGKQACRALDLVDGKEVWQLETGTPSGRGVARGDLYYLPLKEAIKEKAPAVYTIDVRRGVTLGRSMVVRRDGLQQCVAAAGVSAFLASSIPARKELPGNLFFWRDEVISQTATSLTAFGKGK
jgi:hypothetical protein